MTLSGSMLCALSLAVLLVAPSLALRAGSLVAHQERGRTLCVMHRFLVSTRASVPSSQFRAVICFCLYLLFPAPLKSSQWMWRVAALYFKSRGANQGTARLKAHGDRVGYQYLHVHRSRMSGSLLISIDRGGRAGGQEASQRSCRTKRLSACDCPAAPMATVDGFGLGAGLV